MTETGIKSNKFYNKDFLFLWLFHLLTLFGSEMTRFVLPIWIFEQNSNLFIYTLYICSGLVPRIFISPLAGGLIDNQSNKKIMVVSGMFLVAMSLSILTVILGWIPSNFYSICVIVFLMSTFSNFIHIATLSLIPKLLEKQNLVKGNGFIITAESSAYLLAPLIAGILIVNTSFSFVICLDVFFFLIALIFLLNIKKSEDDKNKKQGKTCFLNNAINNLNITSHFIKNDNILIKLLLISSAINFIFSLSFVLFTPMILSTSHNNSKLLGLIFSIGSIGQIIGSNLVIHIFRPKLQINFILKSIIIMGLFGPLMIGLGFSPLFWAVGYAVTLALISIINSLNHAYWQTCSPPNLQGTIFGIRRMISSVVAPVGTLLAGPMLYLLSTLQNQSVVENEYQLVFIISGIIISVIGFSGFYLFPLNQH